MGDADRLQLQSILFEPSSGCPGISAVYDNSDANVLNRAPSSLVGNPAADRGEPPVVVDPESAGGCCNFAGPGRWGALWAEHGAAGESWAARVRRCAGKVLKRTELI